MHLVRWNAVVFHGSGCRYCCGFVLTLAEGAAPERFQMRVLSTVVLMAAISILILSHSRIALCLFSGPEVAPKDIVKSGWITDANKEQERWKVDLCITSNQRMCCSRSGHPKSSVQ